MGWRNFFQQADLQPAYGQFGKGLLQKSKVGGRRMSIEVPARRPELVKVETPGFLRFVEIVNEAATFPMGRGDHAAQQ